MSEISNYTKAEADYIAGMKYKDIADKYGVSLSTVKSWKTRYEWSRDKKSTHTKSKKVCVQNKKDAYKAKAVEEDVKQIISNPELSDKQRLFCCIYIKCFNATKAYQKAYGVDYSTAASIGYRLLANDGVRAEIQRLKQNKLNREMFSEADLFQRYMDIAYTDITDYMEFDNREIDVTGDDGKKHTVKYSAVNIKNDHEIDGTLVSEVSKGKDGVKVKLLDKMRAMEWISKHMDFATEEQRAKVELMSHQSTKMEAEARIAKNKADMMDASGKSFELLESLVDAMGNDDD